MKIAKIYILIVSLVFSQSSFAKESTKQPPALTLNPVTIQTQLLKNNISVLLALNSVHQAKHEVNIARGHLLPSLNLGALLSFTGGGFIQSAIEFLVPFLLPSNWANYFTEKNLFEAEKLSYKVIQLNTYGSALSLYFTILADVQVQQIFQQQYLDLQEIYELQKRKGNLGTVPISDLLQAQAQAQMAGVRSSQMVELNKQEIASMRKVLALPLQTAISLEFVDSKASPWEFESLHSTIKQMNSVSVELAQFYYLIKASESQVWSKSFGWINGASIVSRSNGSSNASFDNMQFVSGINLSFATYPAIQLSQDQVAAMKLQRNELYLENTRLIESAFSSLNESKLQLDLAAQAESQMARVYQIKSQEYDQGSETLTNVLVARNQMSEASIARVKANLDVNLQRTLLHRALITGDFKSIKGCSSSAKMPVEQKKQGPIGRFFNPKPEPKYPSLDQICR